MQIHWHEWLSWWCVMEVVAAVGLSVLLGYWTWGSARDAKSGAETYMVIPLMLILAYHVLGISQVQGIIIAAISFAIYIASCVLTGWASSRKRRLAL